jgi:ribose transport system substrate-binding protein
MRRLKFSVSLVAVIALLAVVVGVVAGRATSAGAKSSGGGAGGPTAGKRIDVIVKASDSSFWQMLAGAKRGGAGYGLTVSLFGPTSETDVNQQVRLVENSISRGVEGIVLAPNSSSALNDVTRSPPACPAYR